MEGLFVQFGRRLPFDFRHHGGERDRRAALAFAFVRSFHEGEDLNRFLGGNRRFARLEELPNLPAMIPT
jgi:hypothetical protein